MRCERLLTRPGIAQLHGCEIAGTNSRSLYLGRNGQPNGRASRMRGKQQHVRPENSAANHSARSKAAGRLPGFVTTALLVTVSEKHPLKAQET